MNYKRHAGQLALSRAAKEATTPITVLHAARGFGKSYNALVDCCEIGLSKQNQRMIFAAPTREEAQKIIDAVLPMVIDDAPPDVKPVERASKHLYTFPSTGSTLLIEGADDNRGNHLRGPHAHYVVCDEAGFWRHCNYVVKSVLLDQVMRVGGRMIVQSTSPESVGHEFVGLCEESIRNESYHKFTIFDNPRLTDQERQARVEAMSGKKGEEAWRATSVRREFLCEFVTELERAVIPEFMPDIHVIDEYARPEFVDCYTFMDLGLVDLTHALFCYWDFERAVMVVEDELAMQYTRTAEVAEKVKKKELDLWGQIPYYGNVSMQSYNRVPWARFSDNDPQILFDLNGYGLNFSPAMKVEMETALHRLRLAFVSGKIEIHKRCTNLIHQLKVGIWNERRTDFERIPNAGHLDGVMALMYGWRMADMKRCPVPPLLGVTSSTHYVPPSVTERIQRTQAATALRGIVRRK